MSELDSPSIDRDIVVRLPDHQVLLNFNGDGDAVRFHEWWENRGIDEFLDWVERNYGEQSP